MKTLSKKESSLTVERLKELLHYDPETGRFTAKVDQGETLLTGQRAGRLIASGYRTLRLDDETYLEHRAAVAYVTGAWPIGDTDHVDGTRSDNRYSNLRQCSRGENLQNQGLSKRNKSGVTGVSQSPRTTSWRAQIKFSGVVHHLGTFATVAEASIARAAAKKLLHKFSPTDVLRSSFNRGAAA